ncbi:MAG TPA: alkaline phosphatase family protein [Actinomycetota bacterium]|nr:alkaline phosphatase family protein [Actinomycetota bacterium]
MPKRVILIVLVALLIGLPAVVLLRPDRGVPEGAPTEDAMAAELGTQVMRNLARGHVPGRSGEVMLVPKPHSFLIGEWDLTTLGTSTPTMSTSHPNPWNYLARVPIIVAGDEWAPRGVTIEDPVDISWIAPTYARWLGLPEEGYASPPLPGLHDEPAPKVIFTVVIDGGGWNALQYHPYAWPNLKDLMDRGTTYVNAHIGSAPSITGALHATFGTGVYPDVHGIPGNQMRGEDGKNTDTWRDEADPRYLEVPTVSELWDEANGNKPLIATISYEGWHLGMIGHGAQREGGDKDLAALWNPEENEWWINEEYYELPDVLETPDISFLQTKELELDERDGLKDGSWFGHLPAQLRENLTRPGTPAFVELTGNAVADMVGGGPFGEDRLTDLVWIEMKMPDYAGHAWNMTSPEEEDVLKETDRQIGRFVDVLDDKVGRDNYVFLVSADHGQQPLPDLYGGWRINSKELQRDIEARFGNVLEKITPVDIYVDRDAMEEEGVSSADIARFVGTYTLGDNIPEGAEGAERVPEGRFDELLFAGAFSTDYLASLYEDPEIERFGEGRYPEGDLTIGDG